MDAAPIPRVSLVIPNWNGMPHLPECLESLDSQTLAGFEVILVDNSSEDHSVSWVRQNWPAVKVLELQDNCGFSKAVNRGILASRGEYVALLNNDTVVDPDWLGTLVDALDRHREYDFAASMMILYDKRDRLNAAGDIYSLKEMSGMNRGADEPLEKYDRLERVLGACAGAALYRRALFDHVGLFDEDFFLMHEDTDFNLRCLIAGKQCLYVPEARVLHKWGASADTRPSLQMAHLLARNSALVAAKDLPCRILTLELLLWPYRVFRRTVPLRPSKYHLFPRLLRQAPARIKPELVGFRLGLKKRREVWRLQAVSTKEIVHWLRHGSGPVQQI